MLSVILPSMLMILVSTLSVIRHLICGNNWNWLLNLNLIYDTLWNGAESGLLISILEKLNWFCLTGLITLVLLMWKWMGLFYRKNNLLRCRCWLSPLNWIGALTLSLLLKLPPRKLEPWFVLWSFFLLWLLCISINLPYHSWQEGHTLLFLNQPPPLFSKITLFLEIQDVLNLHRPIVKAKVLKDVFNWFVYNFYPQSILILEEYLQKW